MQKEIRAFRFARTGFTADDNTLEQLKQKFGGARLNHAVVILNAQIYKPDSVSPSACNNTHCQRLQIYAVAEWAPPADFDKVSHILDCISDKT